MIQTLDFLTLGYFLHLADFGGGELCSPPRNSETVCSTNIKIYRMEMKSFQYDLAMASPYNAYFENTMKTFQK